MARRAMFAGTGRWIAAVAATVAVAGLVQVSAQSRQAVADTAGGASALETTVAGARAAAGESGEPVEVGSLRGESTETVVEPDGSFTTTEHLRPVRARVGGSWQAVDPTLKLGADGIIRPVASTADIEISGGSGPFLRIGRAGRQVALSWPDALPQPVLEGDTARFVDVFSDADLLVTADADGVSHTLEVKTAEAAQNPGVQQLTLGVSGSLNVAEADGGGLVGVDPGSGGAVVEAPTPLMWDSTKDVAPSLAGEAALPADDPGGGPGEGSKIGDVDVGVTDDGVTLTPDADFLDAPDTVFPVFIDPVWKTVDESAWAMVSSGYPTTSYYKFNGKPTEGMGLCEVSKDSSCVKDQKKRLFFRLPTSAFSGRHILSASFTAHETWAYDCNDPRGVELWRTKGFVSGSTWNSTDDNWLDHLDSRDVAHCSKAPVEFHAGPAVTYAANHHLATLSFGLRANQETSMAWWKRFADEAELQVHYNRPPNQPRQTNLSMNPGGACARPADAPVVNDYPTLVADKLSDPDGDKVAAQFKVSWGGSVRWTWTSTMKASGSPFSKRLDPDTVSLPQKTRLSWAVRAWDGAQWSPWSYAGDAQTGCYFSYDSSLPAAPGIDSADYHPESDPENPDDPWLDGVGRYGSFTLNSSSGDVVRYKYWFNDGAKKQLSPDSQGGPVHLRLVPVRVGLNYLRAQAFDAAGNASAIGQYMIRVAAGRPAVAAWALDDPVDSTTLTDTAHPDDLTNAHPAHTSGGVTLGTPGVAGTAMQLNGTDGYAATGGPVVDTSKSFSIAAWARLPEQKPDKAAIVATQAGVMRSGFELYYSAALDRWVFNRYDADSDSAGIVRAKSTAAPQGGEWAHLVGVYDGEKGTIRLYVNGRSQAVTDYTTPWNATGPVQLGVGWYGGGDRHSWFDGAVDDVRVFDRIITGDEVTDLFAQQPVVAARWKLNDAGDVVPAATAYYRLDEPVDATRAEDATGTFPAGKHGGVTFGVTGKSGSAARFDGTSGYLATQGSVVDAAGSFSVSAWTMLPSLPGHTGVVAAQAGSQVGAFALYYSHPSNRWVFNRNAADMPGSAVVRAVSNDPPAPGQWMQLVGVYDAEAQEIRLYVDGVLQQTTSYTTPWDATGASLVGASWRDTARNFFAGDLDDVRFFTQALTGSQAAVLAAGSPAAVTADDGPHGHHARLVGNARIDQTKGIIGNPPGGLVLDGDPEHDGDGGYAFTEGPVIDTNQSFTVTAWVTAAGAPDHKVAVLSQAGDVTSGFVLRWNPHVYQIPETGKWAGGYEIEMPASDAQDPDPPTADNLLFAAGYDWQHLALVYDAFQDQMRLYVNGQLERTLDRVSWRSHVIGFNATHEFQIGRAGPLDNGGEYWPGVIDDVWAFHGVLSDAQIQNLAYPGEELPTDPGP